MNNYTIFQKELHKLALFSKFMRETTFDFEKLLFSNKSNHASSKHVFITGMARSGSTILLNSLYSSDQFSSLTYSDMPFILAPNLWNKIKPIDKQKDVLRERAHGDGIYINQKSPEAFEEIFWYTFKDESSDALLKEFRTYVDLIMNKNNKYRYLSKNNQNINRINQILSCFPDATILIPFREPGRHSFSLISQHKKFISYQAKNSFILKYMNLIGHSEFGSGYKPYSNKNIIYENTSDINHWLEQWIICYSRLLLLKKTTGKIVLVPYELLCRDEAVWNRITTLLDLDNSLQNNFKESKKDILDSDFDQQLIRKAKKIYTKLISLSI